jgi:CheY-like chemotaxis protein
VQASLHILFVEPDRCRAQALAELLGRLGVRSTHATDLDHASLLLTQLQPDGLIVGVPPLATPSLRAWLAGVLAAAPLWTLLYAEHGLLLDVASRDLPPLTTALWSHLQREPDLLLAPLLASVDAG